MFLKISQHFFLVKFNLTLVGVKGRKKAILGSHSCAPHVLRFRKAPEGP